MSSDGRSFARTVQSVRLRRTCGPARWLPHRTIGRSRSAILAMSGLPVRLRGPCLPARAVPGGRARGAALIGTRLRTRRRCARDGRGRYRVALRPLVAETEGQRGCGGESKRQNEDTGQGPGGSGGGDVGSRHVAEAPRGLGAGGCAAPPPGRAGPGRRGMDPGWERNGRRAVPRRTQRAGSAQAPESPTDRRQTCQAMRFISGLLCVLLRELGGLLGYCVRYALISRCDPCS